MKLAIFFAASIATLSALAGCATPTDPRDSRAPAALEEAIDARETERPKPK
ncbi:MAG: hypothetical protein O9270_07905 [Aquidulcibacter sp.]|jgi:hypothetical protein|uniref:hypothetical protein n=1 Tax=Aquidulcibacter sp. TaxID=2052990 RepID=UPI0022C162A1|nr:hypothetical protein [Aquidulcibacter sp.]MCE2890939.1 hypothetical protein [Hyphomonadaceae bacterium]MCZ8208106.1 hypothetical protein [Aquidulcibacter sp.]